MPDTPTSRPGTPATPKQQAYLRALAARSGTTFTPPTDRADASRQITALKSRRPSSRTERWLERRELDEALATRQQRGLRRESARTAY